MLRQRLLRCSLLGRRFSTASPELREDVLEGNFLAGLSKEGGHGLFELPPGAHRPDLSFESLGIDRLGAHSLLRAMFVTRIAHNVSRRAALKGQVYYTIGPGGHECAAGKETILSASGEWRRRDLCVKIRRLFFSCRCCRGDESHRPCNTALQRHGLSGTPAHLPCSTTTAHILHFFEHLSGFGCYHHVKCAGI